MRIETSQRGYALLVGLIFLGLLTLIGISASRSTSLELRMAGNTVQKAQALEASEACRGATAQVFLDQLNNDGEWPRNDPIIHRKIAVPRSDRFNAQIIAEDKDYEANSLAVNCSDFDNTGPSWPYPSRTELRIRYQGATSMPGTARGFGVSSEDPGAGIYAFYELDSRTQLLNESAKADAAEAPPARAQTIGQFRHVPFVP